MSRPIHIRKIIIEFNMDTLAILREALFNYHDYLNKVEEFGHKTPLSKKAIKRRIRYLEDFLDILEDGNRV